MPYFVDAEGTRCALAHLLEIGGQTQLVSDVAARRNNARVHELASHAELIHWLGCAGLTLEEAARIQPSYCTTSYADECFCQPGTRNDANVAVATVLGVEDSQTLRVRIERIEGPATSLTAGDEISAHGIATVGEQIILRGVRGGDAGTVKLAQIDGMWSVSDSSVTCSASDFAQTHPVPIDAALAALRSTYPDCKAVLAAQDLRWQASPPCDESGCACGLGAGYANEPAFTSVAVLSALLMYRRRRRERKLASSSSRSPQR